MARYYHYKTIYINGQNNNIYNIRKGLDIIKAIKYKLEGLIMPLKLVRVQISIRKGRSSNRKRSSSYINIPLPPSKRIYLGSLPKGGKRLTTLNQVYQCVITRDYGKPLYEVSS